MLARTVKDLGSLVKERRKGLGWSQSELAAKIGVQRLWVIQFESGKATAQIGLVLRALRVLNLELQIGRVPQVDSNVSDSDLVDLDAVLTENLNRVVK